MNLRWDEFYDDGYDLMEGDCHIGFIDTAHPSGQLCWNHFDGSFDMLIPGTLEEAKAVVEAMVRLEG